MISSVFGEAEKEVGAKTTMAVAAMLLLFTFATAPFLLYDEMTLALGIVRPGMGPRRAGPAFGERRPSLRVTLDRGRVVVDAELTQLDEKNRLLARAAELYGREQFVDLVSVVPDLKPAAWTTSVEAVLPPFSAVGSDSVVDVSGDTLRVKLAFPDHERRQKYLGQAEALVKLGLRLTEEGDRGGRK